MTTPMSNLRTVTLSSSFLVLVSSACQYVLYHMQGSPRIQCNIAQYNAILARVSRSMKHSVMKSTSKYTGLTYREVFGLQLCLHELSLFSIQFRNTRASSKNDTVGLICISNKSAAITSYHKRCARVCL
jgi:hypothetical protein